MSEQERAPTTSGLPLAAERYEAQLEDRRLRSESLELASLWVTRDRWAHRIVERISFVDNGRMRRLLSIDLELPWELLDAECGSAISSTVVPILAINEAGMLGVEAKNGQGRALPLRTVAKTEPITLAAVRRLLEMDATEPREAPRQPVESGRSEMTSAESLAEAVSRAQLLLVDVPRSSASRELVQVGWEETIHRDRSRAWLPGRIGVRIRAAAVPAASQHVEVSAPPGFEIDGICQRSLTEDRASNSHVRTHDASASIGGGEKLLVSLKPKRRVALSVLAPALSVFGLAVALIIASGLSGSQTAAAAILLAIPSLWAAYIVRADSTDSWVGWDINGLVVGLTSFLGAGALVLGVGRLALDLILAVAALASAITAIAAAASTTLEVELDHRRTRRLALASYVAGSYPSPQPTDEELTAAVERLIESAYDADRPTQDQIRKLAGDLAEERSFVEIARPEPPQLSGVLAEDVLKLTELPPESLAAQLSIAPRMLMDRASDGELDADEHQKLAAVRAAALTLYGGLGRRGLTQWLSTGPDSPLHRIAHGEIEGVQQELDRFLSSPAE